MQDIRLVALDLDGTVFNDKKEITPRTLAAIRNAVARGVAVLPATGRTASGIPAAFTSIPGVRYALTSNGASVVDLQTGQQLVKQPFATADALKIYDILARYGGMLSIFIGGKSYTTRENAENHMDVVPENLKSYFRTTRIEVDDMHATLRTHAHEIEKYSMLYHNEAERDAAWRAVQQACPGMELTSSLPGNMEINAPGVTKACWRWRRIWVCAGSRRWPWATPAMTVPWSRRQGWGWPWAMRPMTLRKLPMQRPMITTMTAWQRQ